MTTPLIEAIARRIEPDWFGEVDGKHPLDNYPLQHEAYQTRARAYAQAALTAITEAGYEIAVKGTIAALNTSRVAIDDWLNTYAHDMCDEKRVKEARDRIYENGGTIAYIARIQEHNGSIPAAQGDGA